MPHRMGPQGSGRFENLRLAVERGGVGPEDPSAQGHASVRPSRRAGFWTVR
jgi:hypothetical protein